MKNKLFEIIDNEIKMFINELFHDSVDWDLYDRMDTMRGKILQDYLFNNNEDMTKSIIWTVIPFYRLKKVWEDYMKYGYVRNIDALDKIETIMSINTIRLYIFTDARNNSPEEFNDYFNDVGERYLTNQESLPNNLINFIKKNIGEYLQYLDSDDKKIENISEVLYENFFDYYAIDKNGTLLISDHGLNPLSKLLEKLRNEKTPEKKLVIIDKMLNIIHMRSDLASWYIEGGSHSLSTISGYYKNDENSWGAKSVISGFDNI